MGLAAVILVQETKLMQIAPKTKYFDFLGAMWVVAKTVMRGASCKMLCSGIPHFVYLYIKDLISLILISQQTDDV